MLKYILIFTISICLISCSTEREQENSSSTQSQEVPSSSAITPQTVYSVDFPANWHHKAEEHIPIVKILSGQGKNNIQVSVSLKKIRNYPLYRKNLYCRRERKTISGSTV